MCDVDRYVDRLYQPVISELKLSIVKSQWHRYVTDLNRLSTDVDSSSVEGSENPAGKFTTGLHWVKTTRGQVLMEKPISQALHEQLVERYFTPFHSDLKEMYQFFQNHGAKKVYHLDAHSMPSIGTSAHRDPGQLRAEIVVSDWDEKSCDSWFKELVIEAYKQAGLKVAYNWPYLGGRVTQTYGKPSTGQNAMQVEINRSMYMDEVSKALIPDKAKLLSDKLTNAVKYIYERIPKT